jgi:hypothetical protein
MRKDEMTDAELDAVAGGGRDTGGTGGVKGFTAEELDSVAGGSRDTGGTGGVKA